MARIAGVDLPREKRAEIGLTYIYGIGRVSANKILAAANVNPDTRVRDLTDEEVKMCIRDRYRYHRWWSGTCSHRACRNQEYPYKIPRLQQQAERCSGNHRGPASAEDSGRSSQTPRKIC